MENHSEMLQTWLQVKQSLLKRRTEPKRQTIRRSHFSWQQGETSGRRKQKGRGGFIQSTLRNKRDKKEYQRQFLKNQGRNAVTRSAIGIDSIESSKIFDNVDEEASFPGGIAACMKYIADNFRYPNIQGDCSIQGKIVVTFTVNEDGNLNDIKVKKSVYSDLDKEAVRVVKSMPKWIPAKQNGKAVKSKYTLPVYIHVQ